jgi:diguanylate cyclase (GGDEF)-like protein
MLFGIAFALRNYGLIPTNFLTLHGLQFGSVIGMLLLSFALADRIQTERRAKEAAQGEALAAKQANIENLQRSERELEQRVAARTAELAAANERLLTSEQQQRDLAQHDMLTGLANRALFSDRLNQALAIAQRNHTRVALLYLDLDKFKPVNDTHGHAVGDVLLKEVAQRMTQRVRESDTVARIGGDEFVILLRAVDSNDGVIAVADSIRSSLNQPFLIENHPITISGSIGIAIYPDHGHSETELSRRADEAMYRAKVAGRDIACLANGDAAV